MLGFSSGCSWLQIPEVSQVEKGEHRHQAALFAIHSEDYCCILLHDRKRLDDVCLFQNLYQYKYTYQVS